MNNYNYVGTMVDFAGILVFTIVVSILSILVSVILIIALWKLFEEAGEAGWKSLIPYYNTYVMCDLYIAESPVMWFIMLFFPITNFISSLVILYKMALAYDKGPTGGIINIFLGIIYIPIMGFSKDTIYIGPQ